jgi:hypothetical protein
MNNPHNSPSASVIPFYPPPRGCNTHLTGPAIIFVNPKTLSRQKTFDALEWLAAMCSHIANRGDDRTSGSHTIYRGLNLFPKIHTTTIKDISQKAKIINTTMCILQ